MCDDDDYAQVPEFQGDPRFRSWNAWGYVDARDVGAVMPTRARDSDVEDAAVFIIAAADTVMDTPNAELLAAVFPSVPVRDGVGEHGTLLSIEKARAVLGFEPKHSWRTRR